MQKTHTEPINEKELKRIEAILSRKLTPNNLQNVYQIPQLLAGSSAKTQISNPNAFKKTDSGKVYLFKNDGNIKSPLTSDIMNMLSDGIAPLDKIGSDGKGIYSPIADLRNFKYFNPNHKVGTNFYDKQDAAAFNIMVTQKPAQIGKQIAALIICNDTDPNPSNYAYNTKTCKLFKIDNDETCSRTNPNGIALINGENTFPKKMLRHVLGEKNINSKAKEEFIAGFKAIISKYKELQQKNIILQLLEKYIKIDSSSAKKDSEFDTPSVVDYFKNRGDSVENTLNNELKKAGLLKNNLVKDVKGDNIKHTKTKKDVAKPTNAKQNIQKIITQKRPDSKYQLGKILDHNSKHKKAVSDKVQRLKSAKPVNKMPIKKENARQNNQLSKIKQIKIPEKRLNAELLQSKYEKAFRKTFMKKMQLAHTPGVNDIMAAYFKNSPQKSQNTHVTNPAQKKVTAFRYR